MAVTHVDIEQNINDIFKTLTQPLLLIDSLLEEELKATKNVLKVTYITV